MSSLSDDQLARLRELTWSLEQYGPVSWDDWPTGEIIEDWDEDYNEIETEETTPVLGHVVPAKEGAPFEAVMLFLIDPDGQMSSETRELIAGAVNALPALLAEVAWLRAENEAWAVRWQGQFDRAERAETADPGPSQPTDCSSDAAAGLRGPGETPQSVCPHIVTDGTTSHCALAEGQVREVERQRDELAGAVRDIAAVLTIFKSGVNPQVAARRLVSACDRAEGKD